MIIWFSVLELLFLSSYYYYLNLTTEHTHRDKLMLRMRFLNQVLRHLKLK